MQVQGPASQVEILLQTKDFVVAVKPHGVLSVPSREGAGDERTVLGLQLQDQLERKIFPVHRLDFEAAGLIIFALNGRAHTVASRWFEDKTIRKTYQALTPAADISAALRKAVPQFTAFVRVDEVNPSAMHEWRCRILRGKRRAYEHATGKPSLTQAQAAGQSLRDGVLIRHWLLHPLTGRGHQLRYELFRHMQPIIGDALYASTIEFVPDGIALVATQIDFPADAVKDFSLPRTLSLPVGHGLRLF